jgi:hypothetical protein
LLVRSASLRLAGVRIERVPADLQEREERGLELGVFLVGGLDLVEQGLGEGRDALLELGDGLLEAFVFGLGVAVELGEQGGELVAVVQAGAEHFLAVLEEDADAGVLEDRVHERVALGHLLLDLVVEGVGGVLRLPEPAREFPVVVAQGAVGPDRAPP